MTTAAVAPRKQARRRATEARIFEATRAVLSERGFEGMGISPIAQRAGVAKELIYRYFGDLPSLVLAAMEDRDTWLPAQLEAIAEAHAGRPLAELMTAIVLDHARTLRRNGEAQEIRRWELVSDNEATRGLAERREAGGKLVARLIEAGLVKAGRDAAQAEQDAAAVFALISAGITYLVLRGKTLDSYLGIDLRGDAAWQRWERAAAAIIETLFRAPS